MGIVGNKIDPNLTAENIKDGVSIFGINGSFAGGGGGGEYTRPSEWLPLDDLTETDQGIQILAYVQNTDANFVAFLVSGAYTVDWGDGTIENFNSGVKAEHQYDYSNVNLNSDTVAKFGYKQCVIKVTPQAGQSLTSINFDQFHSTIGSGKIGEIIAPYLDILIAGQNINSIITTNDEADYYMVQKVKILNNLITDFSSMFASWHSLRRAEINTAGGTNFERMFSSCGNIDGNNIFLTDTSLGTNFSKMFSNCRSLINGPIMDTSNGLNFSDMFAQCSALSEVPLYNTISGTNFQSMFTDCNFNKIPLFNTANGTNFNAFLNRCYNLTEIPAFDMSNSTSSGLINSLYNISKFNPAPPSTFSLAHNQLSGDGLNSVYTNLPVVTGQTITVTGNYGTGSDDPSIATAKGRTVTG